MFKKFLILSMCVGSASLVAMHAPGDGNQNGIAEPLVQGVGQVVGVVNDLLTNDELRPKAVKLTNYIIDQVVGVAGEEEFLSNKAHGKKLYPFSGQALNDDNSFFVEIGGWLFRIPNRIIRDHFLDLNNWRNDNADAERYEVSFDTYPLVTASSFYVLCAMIDKYEKGTAARVRTYTGDKIATIFDTLPEIDDELSSAFLVNVLLTGESFGLDLTGGNRTFVACLLNHIHNVQAESTSIPKIEEEIRLVTDRHAPSGLVLSEKFADLIDDLKAVYRPALVNRD